MLSSAVLRGGLVEARAVVNLHVDTGHPDDDPEPLVGRLRPRRGRARAVGRPAHRRPHRARGDRRGNRLRVSRNDGGDGGPLESALRGPRRRRPLDGLHHQHRGARGRRPRAGRARERDHDGDRGEGPGAHGGRRPRRRRASRHRHLDRRGGRGGHGARTSRAVRRAGERDGGHGRSGRAPGAGGGIRGWRERTREQGIRDWRERHP